MRVRPVRPVFTGAGGAVDFDSLRGVFFMSDLRKAAQQALEAWDRSRQWPFPIRPDKEFDALRAALAQPIISPEIKGDKTQPKIKPPKHKPAIATVFHEEDGRQQIEFITQVPVGELVRLYADPPLYHMDLMNVAVAVRDACHRAWVTSMENWRGDINLTEIVIDAANRQPLDDKVLWEMWVESPSDVLRFARAIEKAHGIES